ncbi:MAG TPA: replicative DNA helicase [Nitrospirae bacterium]|nr:replicative DNA helicase [bacterium BMS3Abin10]GBE38233.1 replicative DNA helicase [bacterium BMS3Bbin08]HDH01454.1 replicative DNA helicase [Nitrospirota bacterium]HDH51341.1 replicative DNA helicase [Nitrospirota bacterium]HDO25657.1 replicative DNA helicase [Nitrospirota bacterium]
MKQLEATLDRLPPQNIEAEQSVLGAVLLENEALASVIEVLLPEDFYKDAHKKIFLAMRELYEKNEPIDLITLTEQLSRKDQLEEIGGASYLSAIVNQIPTSANIKYHSKIVKEKSLVRNLIRTATEVVTMSYDEGVEVNDLLDKAETKMFALSEKMVKGSFVHVKDVLKDTIEMVDKLYNTKELITGLPTGFRDLDEKTTGFHPGDLIVVGARPGMGKTAFCLNIATYVGIHVKVPVALFSLEMSKELIVLRMVCAEAEVNSQSVRSGYHTREDYRKLVNAAGRLAEAPIFIDDSFNTVLEIRAKARRLKAEHGLGLIIVDYLQLMRGEGSYIAREQVVSDISRSFKALAKDLSVPLIVISQLNRSCEQRGDDRHPLIADLRESGAIEQDADTILFLYRADYYKAKDAEAGVADLDIAKQRNGPTQRINLTFIDKLTKFKDYSPRRDYIDED